mmetsp:Transcript_5632/g.7725  ORF Transcript_5632/g.7725 Transcript_5632/m.7725 type:complete len:352 (-) Transcript_5632:432-1487(-)|eukprot:CAMPEP_0185734834 /NCGR_PEP_ID=MMETSP1171-20130828/23578_1 /TAXON_ID=374046 /ORGANISM="Helicotheca tamensis, Strain CCMP826" /LENGTH=351 /DNA_ID=CAMNT_0028404937 /DNA_START=48 /DNA_END=1103 /DNA_ORIENTATION=+
MASTTIFTLLLFLLTNASFLHPSDAFVQSFHVPVIPTTRNDKGPPFAPTTTTTTTTATTTCLRTTISPSGGGVAAEASSLEDVAKASSQLQTLLLERWDNNNKNAANENDAAAAGGGATEKIDQIENLIQQLIRSEVTFDENQCLYGPLFATIYTTGTKSKPLWEKLSSFATTSGGKRNIQGQKYYKDSNGDGKVMNYSEVYGRSFHIRADGDCARKIRNESPTTFDDTPAAVGESSPSSLSPMDRLKSFINKIGGNNSGKNKNDDSLSSSTSMAKCPIDYLATVKKGSFNLFGKSLDLAIQGTGIARLLYADPNLRIFVSVTENDWEQTAGLEVVQVRVNLVDPEWGELS